MRNLSFPRLRAFNSAAARSADSDTDSLRGARAPRSFTQWIGCLQFLMLLVLSAGVSLAQSIPPDIAKKLDDAGIHVTRRTVAKYREDLRIPSTHQRRVKV